jgi:beta-xylosidase
MKDLPRANIYVQLGIIGLLLVNACAPTPIPLATATQASEQEPVSTKTESPALTPTPTALPGPSYTNPVYKHDFPDPHVILVGDTYYAYGTPPPGTTSNIQVMRSNDLAHWEHLGDALPALPKWAKLNLGLTWAPGVIEIDGMFLMYYVARDKPTDRQCIGVAVSDTPEGPFTDPNEKAFICQGDLGGSIDAYPYQDDDGKLYVYWKNDGNCCGLEVALWVQELSADGMTLIGEPVKLIKMDQAWERPLIENPAMVEHNDKYYLFYSGNWWESHTYAISYAVCETVTGPCEKPLNEPWFKFKPPVMGPGGEAFFTDTEGNLWMAYHAWTGANVGNTLGQRSLHIDLVTFEGDQPVTNGPTSTPQLLP